MRYREFLFEYNRNEEGKRIGAIPNPEKPNESAVVRYKERLQQDPEFSLERAEEIDPTPNKAYVPRIANWWLKGESYADLKQILPQALAQFQQYKQVLNPEHKDINRFKTASEFASVVQTYQAAADKRVKEKEEEERKKQAAKGKYREIYKDNELRVVEILDRAAAMHWGQSTTWCTASKEDASHYKDHSSKGPLLVIIPLPAQFVTYRDDKGELVKSQVRYQYWFERKNLDHEQFKNVKNAEVNPKKLPFFKKLQQIIYPLNPVYKWNPDPSPFDTQVNKIINNPSLIQKVKTPSEELLLAVVKQTPIVVKWIKYQLSEPVQLAAVQQNGRWIPYFVGTVSDRVKIAALKRSGTALEYIKNPTPKMIEIALKSDGYALKYVKNPTPELQLMAVKQDPYTITLVKNPSEEMQLLAVKKDPNVIEYIKNPSKQVQLAAVNKEPEVINYIQKPDEDLVILAVTLDPELITAMNNPSKAVQMAAVEKNPRMIAYVTDPEVVSTALAKDGKLIEHVYSYTKKQQEIAVTQNPDAIFYIDEPSLSAQLIAIEKKPSIYARLYRGEVAPKKVRDLYNSIKSAK
jgi:hypothetical protein